MKQGKILLWSYKLCSKDYLKGSERRRLIEF